MLLWPTLAHAQLKPKGPFHERLESREIVPGPQAGAAFLASAVLPGAGQFMQGSERWVPYLAIETWAWVSYANRRQHGRELEQRYRDIAWSVARRISAGPRRDTVFAYYEAIAECTCDGSGAYDTDPTRAGVQPELDPNTYNGIQWQRARALFLPGGANFPPGSPEYERALEYYLENAIPPGYLWNWGEGQLEREIFVKTISESDRARRSATRFLGLILANHLVSAVDALIIARLNAAASQSQRFEIGSILEPVNGSIEWQTTFRINLGSTGAGLAR